MQAIVVEVCYEERAAMMVCNKEGETHDGIWQLCW